MAQTDATTFDPYYKWLGIPPHEQPPDYYRLLGVAIFEEDAEVIAAAADRQMGHIKSFTRGRYAAYSQPLLNELAKARICLLNAEQKRRYDTQLKREASPGKDFQQYFSTQDARDEATMGVVREVDDTTAPAVAIVAPPRPKTRRTSRRREYLLIPIVLLLTAMGAFLIVQERMKKVELVPRVSEPPPLQRKKPLRVPRRSPPGNLNKPPTALPRKVPRTINEAPAPAVVPPPQPEPILEAFREIPSEVTLPPLEGATTRLAGLPQEQQANLQLNLVGLVRPGSTARRYFIVPRDNTNIAWDVYCESGSIQRSIQQGGSVAGADAIAQFRWEHSELFFDWLPAAKASNAAAQLQNSVLELHGDGLAEQIQLRRAVSDKAPIIVDGWKDAFLWSIACSKLDPLPRNNDLRLAVDPRGFPQLDLIEGSPEAAAKGEQLKWTLGNNNFVGLLISWDRPGLVLRVRIALAYELGSFPGEIFPLSPKQVESHEQSVRKLLPSLEFDKRRAQQKLTNLRDELRSVENWNPENPTQQVVKQGKIRQINGRITSLNSQIQGFDRLIPAGASDLRDRIEKLKSLATEIDGKAEIGLRFYSDVGEHQLVIYEKGQMSSGVMVPR